MYCKSCGKEINDKAVICVHCGAATDNPVVPAGGAAGVNDEMTGGLTALSILLPGIGLIVGIVKLCTGATESGGKCLKYSIISAVVCAVLSGIIIGVAMS